MGNCVSEAWDDFTGKTAAEKAAKEQSKSSDKNIALQRKIYRQTREDFSPYRDLGEGSLADLGGIAGQAPDYAFGDYQQSPEFQLSELGLDRSEYMGDLGSQYLDIGEFEASPGYEFAREEGMRGIENQLSGMGMSNSGRALKELSRYTTGLANQEYGDWYNRASQEANRQYGIQAGEANRRYGLASTDASRLSGGYGDYVNRLSGTQTNQYNQLMRLAGLGQASAGQMAAPGQNMANAVNQQNQAVADANAAAAMQGYQGTQNLLNMGMQGAGMLMSL